MAWTISQRLLEDYENYHFLQGKGEVKGGHKCTSREDYWVKMKKVE